jgi:hypothetical protein
MKAKRLRDFIILSVVLLMLINQSTATETPNQYYDDWKNVLTDLQTKENKTLEEETKLRQLNNYLVQQHKNPELQNVSYGEFIESNLIEKEPELDGDIILFFFFGIILILIIIFGLGVWANSK